MRPVLADSYVQDGSDANTNFGTATDLLVKNGPTGYNRNAYFRFSVAGLANAKDVQIWLVPRQHGHDHLQRESLRLRME